MSDSELKKNHELDQKTIEYRILNTSLLSLRIDFIPTLIETNYLHNFVFESSIGTRLEKEKKTINIFLTVKIFLDEDKKQFVGHIGTLNQFEITNFDEIVILENDQLKIPEIFLLTFFSLSYSTTRGMLTSKASGTCLQKAVMPVINPKLFFQNPIEDSENTEERSE